MVRCVSCWASASAAPREHGSTGTGQKTVPTSSRLIPLSEGCARPAAKDGARRSRGDEPMAMTQPKPATNAFVGYHDLRGYLDLLESKGLLQPDHGRSRPRSRTRRRDRRARWNAKARLSSSKTSWATPGRRSSPTSSRRRNNSR